MRNLNLGTGIEKIMKHEKNVNRRRLPYCSLRYYSKCLLVCTFLPNGGNYTQSFLWTRHFYFVSGYKSLLCLPTCDGYIRFTFTLVLHLLEPLHYRLMCLCVRRSCFVTRGYVQDTSSKIYAAKIAISLPKDYCNGSKD